MIRLGMRASAAFATLAALVLLAGACSSDDESADATDPTEVTEPAGASSGEPPRNPYLADSAWSGAHRSSYAQGSSDNPALGPDDSVSASRTTLPGVPVIVSFSPEYPDGSTVAWTSLSNTPDLRAIAKIDPDTGDPIDIFVPVDEGLEPPPDVALLSGAYNMVDENNHLIVGYSSRFESYGDSEERDPQSAIELLDTYQLPDAALCGTGDTIVGQVLTYDGDVAFATERGMIGLLPGDVADMTDDSLRLLSLNGDRCSGIGVDGDHSVESITNNIAADEDGGIYFVSNRQMYRADESESDGELKVTWSAPYETGETLSAVRLGGGGSGSTPSLMGTYEQEDQLVVITDGQELMHVTLFWRDEVPEDWEPIAAGKDPRIACEAPVTFGDPDAVSTETEQSVLVRDYSSVLVNNRLENTEAIADLVEQIQKGSAALSGGDPDLAPSGIERIDWDPETRTCETVWANPDLAIPNGVPTMSSDSDLVYGIGLRDGTWGLTGVDFASGEDALWVAGPGSTDNCADEQLAQFPDATSGLFKQYFDEFPTSCDNSFYAATEVGPDGAIYTGLFGALGIYRPE